MNWLIISWFLTFGWVPTQDEFVSKSQMSLNPNKIATVASIGLDATLYDKFHIFTDIENYQYVSGDLVYFYPYRVDYTIGATIDINKNISITAKHECDHSVLYDFNSMNDQYMYASSYTSIYVKIQGKTVF